MFQWFAMELIEGLYENSEFEFWIGIIPTAILRL